MWPLLLLALTLSGCTVYHGGVKDVNLHLKDGKPIHLAVEKCDLKVYLALYGVISSEENCKTEITNY